MKRNDDDKEERQRREGWGAYQMSGDRHLATDNEPAGLIFEYYLKESSEQKAQIVIPDSTGNELVTLEGSSDAGLNQLHWDTAELQDVRPGTYRINVTAGKSCQQKFAKLLPPRAFSIGQIGNDLSEDGRR